MRHHDDCYLRKPAIEVRREIRTALGRAPRRSRGIHFVPWLGPQYGVARSHLGGLRLLILGASHYQWCEACRAADAQLGRDMTCRCISELIAYPGEYNTSHWKKVESSILGADALSAERTSLWNCVAYSN